MPDVGDLLQTAAGKWIIHPPTACTNGHTLRPGAVLVGHLACLGHGGGPNIYPAGNRCLVGSNRMTRER